MLSRKRIQATLLDKMLGLIRPQASKLTPRARAKGHTYEIKDPIPNVPIDLTQCRLMQRLEIFGFLAKERACLVYVWKKKYLKLLP